MGEAAPEPGAGMIPGAVVGQVTESQTDSAKVGDYIYSMEGGWQDFVALDAKDFQVIDAEAAPLSTYMGPLGMPGLTAWAGVTQLAKVTDGDIFLVNAASGPVAGTAGQIARARGAKTVVGIAGGPEKCAYLTERIGADAAIDYKAGNVRGALAKAAPDGVDVFFDNVGGDILDDVLDNLRPEGGARVVICGAISQYEDLDNVQGPSLYLRLAERNASMRGFVVSHHGARFPEAKAEIADLIRSGKLQLEEHVVEGIDNFPKALMMLFSGGHRGNLVVRP